jgi:outer membrane protein OmpA-like peptidoglycan-associated protein
MKKLSYLLMFTAMGFTFASCKTSNSTPKIANSIPSVDVATVKNYPLADTVLKYSMKGITHLNLTEKMGVLGNEIASNIGGSASVFQLGEGVVVSLDRGNVFEIGKADLNSNTKAILGGLAYNLMQNPDNYVVVFGRTDNTGSKGLNEKLGYLRGATVANHMAGSGIPQDRFFIQTLGETYPDFFNNSKMGRNKNRRVDILIIPSNELRTSL